MGWGGVALHRQCCSPGIEPHHRHSECPGLPWCWTRFCPCKTPATGSTPSTIRKLHPSHCDKHCTHNK